MAYSLLSTGIDDLEDHQEYAAYLSPSSTTFEHNSRCSGSGPTKYNMKPLAAPYL